MRRILIDYARAKSRDKRGGNDIQVSIQIAEAESSRSTNIDLLALDEALERLEKLDPQQVRIVELRYFSGLSLEETAESMGLSRSTVAREWAVAKAWLRRELTR
jgi:RNA polymerase sigma factor (TIGR02999 family)